MSDDVSTVKMSDTIGKLAEALAAYQSTAANPANSAKNPFLKNKYAPLNEILSMVRPELAKHGLALSQLVVGCDRVGVTTVLMHASGEYISGTVSLAPDASKGLSTAQNAGVVVTYLRRYGVQSILGISGEDDTDGAHGDDKKQEAKPEAKPSKPEPTVDLDTLKADMKSSLDALAKVEDAEVVEGYREDGLRAYRAGQYDAVRDIIVAVTKATVKKKEETLFLRHKAYHSTSLRNNTANFTRCYSTTTSTPKP